MNSSLDFHTIRVLQKLRLLQKSLAAEPSEQNRSVTQTGLKLIRRVRLWLGKLVSFAFARVLIDFSRWFAAGLAGSPTAMRRERRSLAGPTPRLVGTSDRARWHFSRAAQGCRCSRHGAANLDKLCHGD